MNTEVIFYPVLAQVFLVIFLFMLLGKRKLNAAKNKSVDLKQAAVNNKAWPSDVVLVSNNIANQFEIPVLFYVLSLVTYMTNSVSFITVTFAWLFVAARYCHAFVHVTNNRVPIRFRCFLVSVLMVILMLVTTSIHIIV
ncbi:hypothetical protein DRW07_04480 [Alteromonas sediminis]|uniref:MAPEG family protein n=1 Tax=Alteromonas sediminis TaxID=2259342 RepID=A0A3N5ZE99_9ALTE|nr:MAPEG family protein [Alteromonas sediminis]RPJ68658.1 hypothetical protein DRW07_04480 [Alteromonas sediminis]